MKSQTWLSVSLILLTLNSSQVVAQVNWDLSFLSVQAELGYLVDSHYTDPVQVRGLGDVGASTVAVEAVLGESRSVSSASATSLTSSDSLSVNMLLSLFGTQGEPDVVVLYRPWSYVIGVLNAPAGSRFDFICEKGLESFAQIWVERVLPGERYDYEMLIGQTGMIGSGQLSDGGAYEVHVVLYYTGTTSGVALVEEELVCELRVVGPTAVASAGASWGSVKALFR